VNPSLQGYAAAVVESVEGDDLSRLADDLSAVDQLFASNPTLRAALTDTSVSAPTRRLVLLELLEGKVSAPARRAAGFAASAVTAPEVPLAESWLAARARHAAQGTAGDEPALSLLDARRRVGGFATAIFEDLTTSELEEVEDELFRFARTVASTPALRAALTDRDLPVTARQGLVAQLLEGKVQPATARLADFVVVGGRARDFVGTMDWLVEQVAKARGWRVARVTAGAEVDPDERERLADSLSRLAQSPVELQVTVDPRLLAGVLVEVGDLQVDATARGRLDHLREHLLPSGWDDHGIVGPAPRTPGGGTSQHDTGNHAEGAH